MTQITSDPSNGTKQMLNKDDDDDDDNDDDDDDDEGIVRSYSTVLLS